MISMSLEEGLVMYIDAGAVTVRRRRFEFGMTHAACYLPLPQVAVKAFRFRFSIDGDANKGSAKVTYLIHNL